ncbi:MAG: 2OG-Fe(II) oxygenase [Alphaproteobacteria bacterium]
MNSTEATAVIPGAATNDNVAVAYIRSVKRPPLFSDDECDAVIAWAQGRRLVKRAYSEKDASRRNQAGKGGKQILIDPRTSDERIAWFVRKVEEITFDLNRKIWRFEITHLSRVAILRYDEGDRFSQHVDLAPPHCDRKIGVFIQLSPPEAYEGGVLEYGIAPAGKAPRGRGAVLAFPAWVPHRVIPVRSGTRYAAACFALGPSFR